MRHIMIQKQMRRFGRAIRDRAPPELGGIVTITCISLIGTLAFVMLLNWAADMQQDREENLYIDAFHYTAPFSRDIATLIAAQFLSDDANERRKEK